MSVAFSKDTQHGSAVRLDHSSGISVYLNQILTREEFFGDYFLFFDFDRLLTNGYELSGEGDKAPVEKRIRGGAATVQVINELKTKGAHLCVVTARSPKVGVIEQLQAALQTAQAELAPCFEGFEKAGEILENEGKKFATNGVLYATGYQKDLAIGHLLSSVEYAGRELKAFFFDDAVTNAHTVLSSWKSHLPPELVRTVSLTSVWVDPFFEETEAEGEATMIPVHSQSTDFNFHEYLMAQLEMFGISKEEAQKRRDVYLSEEKKYNRKAPELKVKPPDAKKMDNVEEKFSGLASLFGKRL